MQKLILTLLLFLPLSLLSQNCDCESNLNWVRKTFEENDAGFEYALAKKGTERYKKHNATFTEKANKISSITECEKLVQEWLSFFRKGHKGFSIINNVNGPNIQTREHETISSINPEKFKKYLLSKKEMDYEGVWESEPYTVAIKKIDETYKAVVINVSSGNWNPGEVKFYINSDSSGIYYMGDYSEYPFSNVQYLDEQVLNINGIYFKRTFPIIKETNPNLQRYLELINASSPSIRKLNDETYLFRIPTFDLGQKEAIDSLITKYLDRITSSKNLIIDLRGNTGGAGKSYNRLLPVLYTNPIKTIYWKHKSTELNNKRWEEWLQNPNLSEEGKTFLTNVSNKLKNNLGQFVYIYDNNGSDIFHQDFQYDKLKNIAILVDKDNASTTEQFLLAAKQSKKVKIYGETTFGALDISEINQVKSPDENFMLAYCLTKSLRLPDFPIDGIGIQPDYYLDKSILPYNWIDYVIDNLKK